MPPNTTPGRLFPPGGRVGPVRRTAPSESSGLPLIGTRPVSIRPRVRRHYFLPPRRKEKPKSNDNNAKLAWFLRGSISDNCTAVVTERPLAPCPPLAISPPLWPWPDRWSLPPRRRPTPSRRTCSSPARSATPYPASPAPDPARSPRPARGKGNDSKVFFQPLAPRRPPSVGASSGQKRQKGSYPFLMGISLTMRVSRGLAGIDTSNKCK